MLKYQIITLLLKAEKSSQKLGDIAHIYQGIITGNNKKFLSREKENQNYYKIIRGVDVTKYHVSFNDYYVLYDPEELWSNTDPKMFLVPSKIISRQTSDHLVAALDKEQFFTLDSTHVIHPQIDHFYFLTIFNSKLINFIYQQLVPEVGKVFAQVKTVNLKSLPIRRISYATPAPERAPMVSELQQLYDAGKFDEILPRVEACLPKDVEGSFIPEIEKSDIIHDHLVFLAEQMIEMNKAKQTEIKGFLHWLEGYIGTKVETLSNKTKILAYFDGGFEEFLEVLKKNRKKLSSDPARRQFQEDLEMEFRGSISKLRPLLTKIEETDQLIDQIVYKLYGLTEEEIKIVESGS